MGGKSQLKEVLKSYCEFLNMKVDRRGNKATLRNLVYRINNLNKQKFEELIQERTGIHEGAEHTVDQHFINEYTVPAQTLEKFKQKFVSSVITNAEELKTILEKVEFKQPQPNVKEIKAKPAKGDKNKDADDHDPNNGKSDGFFGWFK